MLPARAAIGAATTRATANKAQRIVFSPFFCNKNYL
jgi:hypothetical protein